MNDHISTEARPLNENKLIEKLNIYNTLLNQAEKIAKLGHWEWTINDNNIIWSNNLFILYGLERDKNEISFELFISAIHPDDRSFVQNNIGNALKNGIFTEFYHRIICPHGEIKTLHARGEVICDDNGIPIKMMGTAQDVTEIKLAEQELFSKAAELEIKNIELKNFAFVASHDLQEPLRKLTVFCSLLQANYNDKLDTKANEYIQKIVSSSIRMRNLISNILELSSISNNIQYSNVDMNVVLNSVLTDLETAIETSGARITSDLLPVIEANETQMYQVLQNLISNAIKFRRPGQPPIIEITSKVTENKSHSKEEKSKKEPKIFSNDHLQCAIAIKDNGTGFQEESIDKLFAPFQTLHDRSSYKGNGIGLVIVKKMVEAHKGSIGVKSKPGSGSIFTITIPLKHSKAPLKLPGNIERIHIV